MVVPCGSRSSTPITRYAPASRAAAPSVSVTGPGTTTAWSTRRAYHSSSPAQIGPESIQIGVPGMKTSGKTTIRAPSAAALASRSSAVARHASRSIKVYAACTAASFTVAIAVPLPRGRDNEHLARTDEPVRALELGERRADLVPRRCAVGLGQAGEHLVQRTE